MATQCTNNGGCTAAHNPWCITCALAAQNGAYQQGAQVAKATGLAGKAIGTGNTNCSTGASWAAQGKLAMLPAGAQATLNWFWGVGNW